jgi:hypothetical protein
MGETATRSLEMHPRRTALRLLALTVVLALPLIGLSGVASAKAAPAKSGSAQSKAAPNCVKHPNRAKCLNGGTGSGSGSGAAPPLITVTASPNPVLETAESDVITMIQVETSPSFAGDDVNISSSQFLASCRAMTFNGFSNFQTAGPDVSIPLDNDGNATIALFGGNCAPGTSVIEASLTVAPFYTALTTLQVSPPAVSPAGVSAYPNPEVEQGDVAGLPPSQVYAVFYVETDPVYAEQLVELDSNELDSSCTLLWEWGVIGPGGTPELEVVGAGPGAHSEPIAQLDNDGNAVFYFGGEGCAAGTWDVIADVLAGTDPTYVTTFTVDPPAPTI